MLENTVSTGQRQASCTHEMQERQVLCGCRAYSDGQAEGEAGEQHARLDDFMKRVSEIAGYQRGIFGPTVYLPGGIWFMHMQRNAKCASKGWMRTCSAGCQMPANEDYKISRVIPLFQL